MPMNFATTPEGVLFAASGFDPMLQWDGSAAQLEPVGLDAPTTALTVAVSGTGLLNGDYYAYVRFLDKDRQPSNLSPISTVATATDNGTVTYTNVPVPTDARVVRRQILRNTAGQADTFYVDVDTTDVISTTFSSTTDDETLFNDEAVPILDDNGGIFANQYGIPPNFKGALAHHLGRMFAAVEYEYRQGLVEVTFGSKTVQGIGTEFTASLAGRFLYVIGADKPYQIDTVDTTLQTLTLLDAAGYLAATDLFAGYAVRPPPAQRRLIYYTQAGLPFAWTATNALAIQEDGDEITGLMTKGSFIYILEKRHVYRFTFQNNPADDGFVFLSSVRGCINNRCWVLVEDLAYMLDEAGIHAFSGGQESEPISTPIQDLFRPSASAYRINWQAQKWFHAAHFAAQECIRWFVTMAGVGQPRHAICYNYRSKRWWLEEYLFPVAASCVGNVGGLEFPRTLVGSDFNKVFVLWEGTLDGPDPAQGTVRGTVTSATLTSLSDSAAMFATAGLVGAPLVIVSGKGKGQRRLVAAVAGTKVSVSQPWLIEPDTTSVYQLGGIPWIYQSGWFRFVPDEQTNPRRVELIFEPLTSPGTADLQFFIDFSSAPLDSASSYRSQDMSGVASVKGTPFLTVDLTRRSGFVQQRFDSHKDQYADGPRFFSFSLSGVTNEDPVLLYGATIDGVGQ